MLDKLFSSKKRKVGINGIDWLFIAVGLVIFAFLTFWTISKSSIWFDEAFGAYMIHFNFVDIARYTAADVHPPVYYWLLKIWSMWFGNTELALRSMSALFGGVAIIFGYLLTHKLFNKTVARVSLLFMIISPMMIRYSQEARMYALVTAIALAATYVLMFAIESKKKLPWIVYGLLVGLGMWIHYFVAIVWIAHWIWRADVIRRTEPTRKFIKKFFSKGWLLAHVIAIAIFIPWLPSFIAQATNVQVFGFWIPPVTPNTPVNFLSNTIYYQDSVNVTGWMAFWFIALAVTLLILAVGVYKKMNEVERQSYRLVMTIAFVPVILLFLLSMPPLRSSFIDRYLITSTLGIAIFIGVTLAYSVKFIGSVWRTALIVFVAALMIIGVGNVWWLGNYNKNSHDANQTRQIIQAAAARSKDGQPIIAVSPFLFYEAIFYSTNDHPVYFFDQPIYKYGSLDMLKNNPQHKITDVAAFTKQNPIVWYVGFVAQGDLTAPYPNWTPLQEVKINDPISGKPEYEAIQYKISIH